MKWCNSYAEGLPWPVPPGINWPLWKCVWGVPGFSPLLPVSTTLILERVLRSSADIPAFVGQISQVNTPLPWRVESLLCALPLAS